ncbi:hypothetical protein [Rhodoflexus caldus]|nr:hypothetical protein [Rhodoflexus caldus]
MKVYDVEKDGLHDKNDPSLVGRIAFIFDGKIVSVGYWIGNWEANSDER